MTKVEIIDETVEWFSEHPRCVDGDGLCVYEDSEGNRCAVGRALTERGISIASAVGGGIFRVWPYLDDRHFLEGYAGHELDFWKGLQMLHDTNGNWIPGKGLSESGAQFVELLKGKWGPSDEE